MLLQSASSFRPDFVHVHILQASFALNVSPGLHVPEEGAAETI